MPCGAGLCVRREVLRVYFDLHANGKRRFVLDRIGDSLVWPVITIWQLVPAI